MKFSVEFNIIRTSVLAKPRGFKILKSNHLRCTLLFPSHLAFQERVPFGITNKQRYFLLVSIYTSRLSLIRRRGWNSIYEIEELVGKERKYKSKRRERKSKQIKERSRKIKKWKEKEMKRREIENTHKQKK